MSILPKDGNLLYCHEHMVLGFPAEVRKSTTIVYRKTYILIEPKAVINPTCASTRQFLNVISLFLFLLFHARYDTFPGSFNNSAWIKSIRLLTIVPALWTMSESFWKVIASAMVSLVLTVSIESFTMAKVAWKSASCQQAEKLQNRTG